MGVTENPILASEFFRNLCHSLQWMIPSHLAIPQLFKPKLVNIYLFSSAFSSLCVDVLEWLRRNSKELNNINNTIDWQKRTTNKQQSCLFVFRFVSFQAAAAAAGKRRNNDGRRNLLSFNNTNKNNK